MPADDEPLISLDELASTLERYEGPARPQRNPAARASRWRFALVAAAALLVGSGLGFGVGNSVTPRGEAAGRPVGLGFIPAAGWSVDQSGADASPASPAYAIASSVPISPEDDGSFGLPYETLLGLPPNGIVIVATFTVPRATPIPGEDYPARTLPLRLREATPFIQNGAQIRPDRPLAEYQLRARVSGRDVDLKLYFGVRSPSRRMIAAAQRQLDGLVVQPPPKADQVAKRALPLRLAPQPQAVTAPAKIIDRTFRCTPGVDGVPIVDVSGGSGYRKGRRFQWLAQVRFATVGSQFPRDDDYKPTMAGFTAGWPPPRGIPSGGLGVHVGYCKATRAIVPLVRQGLAGGEASQFGDDVRCLPPATVLLRLRAVFRAPISLELDGKQQWLSGNARITKAQLALRTLKGKPLVYGEVAESGEAWLYTRC